MSPRPTGLDQSWGFADPKTAAKAGVEVASMYLSWDPSKNVTSKDVKAYHKAGIGVMLNWENNAGAPLAGAAQARADATEAVRQARQLIKTVGYPPTGTLIIYFSCDRDVNAGQFGPIFAYYREARRICRAAGFGVGAYGEASLVTALAKAKITDAEWQTYAWSNGAMSPDADFYQYRNGQTLGGASVDLDRIIHADQLGAWWPPGHDPSHTAGEFPMNDAEARAAFAAINKRLDQMPAAVWNTRLPHPTDPKRGYTAASWVTSTRIQAGMAAAAAKGIAVDAAGVATDITARVRANLTALFGGNQ
jgi:hypothetical protein